MNTRNPNTGSFFRPSRRQVLGASFAAATGTLAARFGLRSLAHAQTMTGAAAHRRFIFCYFPGGWDQLLFLDPRDPASFTEDARGRTLTDVRYEQLEAQNGFEGRIIRAGNLTFGPATEKSAQTTPKLTAHADRIAIVRGLNMNTLAHEGGRRYFITGKEPIGNAARGTSVASELAAQMGSSLALPVLSMNVEAYNDRHPGKYNALRVNSLDDLLMVLNRGTDMVERDAVETALDEYARTEMPCDVNVYDRRGLLTQMREANSTTRTVLSKQLSMQFQFVTDPTVPASADSATRARIEAIIRRNALLRERYGIALGNANNPGARAALAALAIKEGVSQCVSVSIGNGTDTHFSDNLDHANRLYPGVAALSALIDDLAQSDAPMELGGKWLDHTTVVAFSEFSRTPMMNQFGGRDHHQTSSCLIAGAGIKGNTVVGASGDVGMGSGLWDFTNHRPSSTGQLITPDHISATLLASAGLDPEITRVRPIDALLR